MKMYNDYFCITCFVTFKLECIYLCLFFILGIFTVETTTVHSTAPTKHQESTFCTLTLHPSQSNKAIIAAADNKIDELSVWDLGRCKLLCLQNSQCRSITFESNTYR